MDYQTFAACDALSSFVKCHWTLRVPSPPIPPKQRIVADGCIEMIFTCGDDIKRYCSEEEYIIQPRAMILGQITKPLFIQPLGQVDTFATRFFPWGFTPFTTHPLRDLENRETPLTSVFEKEAISPVINKVVKANSTGERIKCIEAFLLEKLTDQVTIDHIVQSTIDVLLASNGQVTIKQLSQNDRSKRRQLERRFLQVIGLSPKQMAKVIRMQNSLRRLLDGTTENLTDLAYEGDFYDQSHFIKDFKEFTGVTPKKFYDDDQLALSSRIYTD